jgi:hypothetical protein
MRRTVCLVSFALLLAACGRQETASTPLPTKQGTVGRVNQGLEKADEDAAKRRAQVERAAEGGEPDEDKPAKSISSGY